MGFSLLDINQIDYEFCGLRIHQPTIAEFGEILREEQDLFFCLKIFSEPIRETFAITGIEGYELTEYDCLCFLLTENPITQEKYAQQRINLNNFLKLLFPNAEIEIYNDNIMIIQDEVVASISNDNLGEFKNIIKKMFKLDSLFFNSGQGQAYDPVNDAARKIAEKLKQSQVKIAAQKGGENKIGIIENYLSILSIGLKTTPSQLSKVITLYTLLTLYERFQMKMEWDLDIKVKLAGGGSENNESPRVWFSII